MRHFIRNPEFPKWNAHSPIVRTLLGLSEKAKLPKEGMPPRVIQGIEVWVTPLAAQAPGLRKRSAHRVMARCPRCEKVMSVGRLHQHVCPEVRAAHTVRPYPHPGGCEECREARVCNYCGTSTRGDYGRCTNGRCSGCHARVCTPGGITSPGHGYGDSPSE